LPTKDRSETFKHRDVIVGDDEPYFVRSRS